MSSDYSEMASPSARRIDSSDYWLIHATLTKLVARLKQSKRKAIYQYLDVDVAVEAIYSFEHSYVVNGSYLVVYDIMEPWFVEPGVKLLGELLVLRLAVCGDSDFSVVPAFLEARAREAGCKLAVAGTALAKADKALASLYQQSGFNADAITLTKEP